MSLIDSLPPSLANNPPSHQTPLGHPEFVQIDSKYVCGICKDVLRDAVQTLCGHRYCLSCIDQKLQIKEGIPCPANKKECMDLKRGEINRDTCVRREVRDLQVYCTYKDTGCTETLAWRDLQQTCQDPDLGDKDKTESILQELQPPAPKPPLRRSPRKSPRKPSATATASSAKPTSATTSATVRSDNMAHEKKCDFRRVPCPYLSLGCEENVVYRNTESHKQECLYKPYKCQFCNQDVPTALKQQHETDTCTGIPIPCQYNCGTDEKPRQEMQEHMVMSCPMRPRQCRYHSVGCDFKETDVVVKQHERDATDRHLQLVIMYTSNIKLQSLIEVRREIQDLSEEREQSRRNLQDVQHQMEGIKSVLEDMKTQVRDMKRNMVNQTEKVIHLERQLEDHISRDLVDRHGRDIQIIQGCLTGMNERIGQLERVGLDQIGAMVPSQAEGAAGNLVTQIQKQARQLVVQDYRLEELDIRFQMLDTASYDGTLTWKIKHYSRRKEDAIAGRTLSLFSQPFYTSRTGYKMCARIYLNGDGLGRGTHMSLYFVVMRSEFDALLPWPFKQRVTLMLLDQLTGTRHLSDSFTPHPNSSSFQKPTTEMNTASGCPLFVNHGVLETSDYLVDDALFIKVIVDTCGLK